MSNASFSDGRIKIGMSSKDPVERKRELESSGVPEPFVIEYKAMVDDYQKVERHVHRDLDNWRPNKNREFFTCSVSDAIISIKSIAKIAFEENNYMTAQEWREEERRKQIKKEKIVKASADRARERERRLQQHEKEKRLKQLIEKPKDVKQKLLWTWGVGLVLAPLTSGVSLVGSLIITPTRSDFDVAKENAEKATLELSNERAASTSRPRRTVSRDEKKLLKDYKFEGSKERRLRKKAAQKNYEWEAKDTLARKRMRPSPDNEPEGMDTLTEKMERSNSDNKANADVIAFFCDFCGTENVARDTYTRTCTLCKRTSFRNT